MDEEFTDPRLAAVYDALDPDRSDLLPYLACAQRLDVRRVLDVGCGTGVFALLLAARGIEVVGVDPAVASLDVARSKPGADQIAWLHGDASAVRATQRTDFDLATMTANVAMVLLSDEDASGTLAAIASALRPGGRLMFETRRPDARAWLTWTPEATRSRARLPAGGWVESWVEVDELSWPYLDFGNVFLFDDGERVRSRSRLRYRELDEWRELLAGSGFNVTDVMDAPDRPGREWLIHAVHR